MTWSSSARSHFCIMCSKIFESHQPTFAICLWHFMLPIGAILLMFCTWYGTIIGRFDRYGNITSRIEGYPGRIGEPMSVWSFWYPSHIADVPDQICSHYRGRFDRYGIITDRCGCVWDLQRFDKGLPILLIPLVLFQHPWWGWPGAAAGELLDYYRCHCLCWCSFWSY